MSLWNLRERLCRIGLPMIAARVPIEVLQDDALPCVAVLRDTSAGARPNALHFVVVCGVREDGVFIADSSGGTWAMPRPVFDSRWIGIALLSRLPGAAVRWAETLPGCS